MPIDVETFEGPMFLSVGTNDQTWSSEMTARLQDRREKAGLPVEAHYYTGEGHVPGSEGENMHHALLLSFFRRTLAPDV
ncbi:alpha/beta hydrolase family protein [Hoeflea prorocentri]